MDLSTIFVMTNECHFDNSNLEFLTKVVITYILAAIVSINITIYQYQNHSIWFNLFQKYRPSLFNHRGLFHIEGYKFNLLSYSRYSIKQK